MTSVEGQRIAEDISPIALQRPFGFIQSESDRWFEYTFGHVIPDLIGDQEKEKMDSRLRGNDNISMNKSAVVTLAHPDDAEDLVGGTIAMLAHKGFDITLVIVTDGRWGIDHRNPMCQQDLIQRRLEETLLGAQELGVSKVINLGIEDREVPQDPKIDKGLLNRLVDVYRENPASVYITHATPENNLTKDYHGDHQNTARFALEAIQRSRNGNAEMTEQPILLYADTQGARNAHSVIRRFGKMLPKASAVDFLLDTTATFEQKERAFRHHTTQIGNTPGDVVHDYVFQSRHITRFRADQARRKWWGLMRPTFAEGWSIHTGQGFRTDVYGIFDKKDVYIPKRNASRRSAPIFG